jgi:ligand-binding SRPBCC domain-containing protein
MDAIGASRTLYEDRVEFVLRGGAVVHRLFERPVRRLLARMFEQRHRVVQARLAIRAGAAA